MLLVDLIRDFMFTSPGRLHYDRGEQDRVSKRLPQCNARTFEKYSTSSANCLITLTSHRSEGGFTDANEVLASLGSRVQ